MPSFALECEHPGPVAGIDEVGRGPLAGPVVAAAVVLDRALVPKALLRLIDDSKRLSVVRRQEAYAALRACPAVAFGLGAASVGEIDRHNILQATFLAMRRALARLPATPARVLVDGNRDPRLHVPARLVVGGDAASYSIAAASIFAKVTRDRIMSALAGRYPGYDWHSNMGYGSGSHLGAIERLGATPHHRRSFAPLNRLL